MSTYAAHDHLSIYAVAETPEAAIAKARDEAKDDSAEFETSPITDEFAAWIDENGWDGMARRFDKDANGYLIDTTDPKE